MKSRLTGLLRLAPLVLLGAACLHLASSAIALQRGRGFGFGPNRAQLATLKEVQEELKLNDEQAQAAREATNAFNADLAKLTQSAAGDLEKVRLGMPELHAKATSAILKRLDSAQRKRLDEIFIQQNGVNSVFDSRVRKALKLTDEQMTKLTAARKVNREAGLKAMREEPPGETPEARTERFSTLWKESEERILKILTKEQRKQFAMMRGKEFEVNLRPLFPAPSMPQENASRDFDD